MCICTYTFTLIRPSPHKYDPYFPRRISPLALNSKSPGQKPHTNDSEQFSWLIVKLLYIIFTRFLPTTSNHFGIYKASRKVCIMLEVSLVLLGAYEIQCNADWIPKYPAGAQGFHPTKFIPRDLDGSLRSRECSGIVGSIYPVRPY